MIKLRRAELNSVYNFLDNTKLNRISNTTIRNTILKIILTGKKESEVSLNSIGEIRNKFFGEFPEEELVEFQDSVNKITQLIRDGKHEEANAVDAEASKKYPKILDAYRSFNEALNDLQKEVVEVNIEPISMEEFLDAMVGQDLDITGDIITKLTPIFENGSEN